MPYKVKALLVDDEPNILVSLKILLNKHFPEIEVVGEANNVKNAVTAIRLHLPDLVLLDINLPDGDGFEVLDKTENFNYKFIFISAYNEFAIKAFEMKALHYLLKPIQTKLFIQAIENFKKYHFPTQESTESYLNRERNKILLPVKNELMVVNIDQIIRCESLKNNTKIFLQDHRVCEASKTLNFFESILEDLGFFRVHYSHLVNFSFIESFLKNQHKLILFDKSNIDISIRRMPEFTEKYMDFLKNKA